MAHMTKQQWRQKLARDTKRFQRKGGEVRKCRSRRTKSEWIKGMGFRDYQLVYVG